MDILRDPLVPRGATCAQSAPDSGGASARRRLPRPIAFTGLAAALLVGLPSVLVGGASGAGALTPNLPEFPNNLTIFPNRDFISIEGFQDHAGEAGLVEVTRPGEGVIGSAIGTVTGDDVAFEINHPGGYCWGAGTGLAVTPDIQAGDVVSLSFGGTVEAATTTLDVYASDAIQNGTTVTVNGHIGAGVDVNNIEQRIIEPALVDTIVGKRDVRALPGPMTPAAKGGYSSELVFGPDETFVATYIFDVEADAHTAANAGLGERAMAWEFTDPAGNRQGLTIAEFGELGGPGMGGCPNGPLQSGPPAPTNIVAANVSNGIAVDWTPAVAIPGTPAIDGYEVMAVALNANGNENSMIGKRIADPAATGTTLTGLDSSQAYNVEVVSYSAVGKTFPAANASVETDSTPPAVAASPNGGSYPVPQQVTLTSTDIGSDIYFTTDGSDPVDNAGPINTATLFTTPITISGETTLKFAAFDPSGNVSPIVTQTFNITNDPVPAATSFTSSSVGLDSVTLDWAAADPGSPLYEIAGYEIKAYLDAAGTILADTRNTSGTGTTATVDNLTGDMPYWFTVAAKNTGPNPLYGPASALYGPVTPQGALVADAGFDQSAVVRGTVVNLTGAGSTSTGATYAWTQILTGNQTALDNVIFTPASGLARDVSFTLPFFRFPMSNTPLTFRLAVTVDGVTKTDDVVISPRSDVVSIATARWKPGDFRVVGTSSPNSTVTVRSALTGTVYGTAVADATGAFSFRLRAGVPTVKPAAVVVDSNMGGTSAPFNVAG